MVYPTTLKVTVIPFNGIPTTSAPIMVEPGNNLVIPINNTSIKTNNNKQLTVGEIDCGIF